jgi:plasmid stabilization system protein ParE
MTRVRWEGRALNELTDMWANASSAERRAITDASHKIDQRLGTNPTSDSESRPGGRRITFVAPLAVTFRIEEGGHLVSVLQVRMMRRRKSW